jgi:uncharacterized membrane protein YcaP (DUF421 family)
MLDLIDQIMGLSLKSEQLGFGQMAARAVVMYVALIIVVRSAKKRFLSNATAFDFILTVMVGAVAARAMTGGAPFFASLLAVMVLVGMHWTFSALAQRWRGFGDLIKGHSTLLINAGKVDAHALSAAHMSMDDLREDLRAKGVRDPAEVDEARLERNGKLSVLKK